MNNEEKLRVALERSLTNVANYPQDVSWRLLGVDLSKVIDAAFDEVMASGVVEKIDTMHLRPEIDRVEVIDERGRAYMNYQAREVMTSLQDDGKTLKVFTKSRGYVPDFKMKEEE